MIVICEISSNDNSPKNESSLSTIVHQIGMSTA